MCTCANKDDNFSEEENMENRVILAKEIVFCIHFKCLQSMAGCRLSFVYFLFLFFLAAAASASTSIGAFLTNGISS